MRLNSSALNNAGLRRIQETPPNEGTAFVVAAATLIFEGLIEYEFQACLETISNCHRDRSETMNR